MLLKIEETACLGPGAYITYEKTVEVPPDLLRILLMLIARLPKP